VGKKPFTRKKFLKEGTSEKKKNLKKGSVSGAGHSEEGSRGKKKGEIFKAKRRYWE